MRVSPWANKEENARKAIEHTKLCDQLCSNSTLVSIERSVLYEIEQLPNIKDSLKMHYK